MTTPLEHDLTRTMTAAADAAPGPVPGFFAELADRGRERRRRRLSVATSAAAVVFLAAGFATFRLVVNPGAHARPPAGTTTTGTTPTGAPNATTPAPPADRIPRLKGAIPVEKVWPQAVRTLPDHLPDGRSYLLNTILSDGGYLVVPLVPNGEGLTSSELLRWEPATNSVTVLGAATPPKRFAAMRPSGPAAIGEGRVAWIMSGELPPNHSSFGVVAYQEIWVAPLNGGPGTRVAVVNESQVSPVLEIVSGHVVWSQASPTQVDSGQSSLYRVPLSGGAPALVPGGDGYVLLMTAPWAQKGTDNYSGSEQLNLADGTRRPVASDGPYSSFRCSSLWCVGRVNADWHMFIQRLDGSGQLHTPFTGDFEFTSNDNILIGISPATGTADEVQQLLWDVRTGQVGTFAFQPYDPAKSSARGMASWLTPNGQLVVIDPAAMG